MNQAHNQVDTSPRINSENFKDSSMSLSRFLLTSWGVLGVLCLIGNAIMRLLPIALQPVIQGNMPPSQKISYILWVLFMMYVEGYKSFHQKFSPLVVQRALTIADNPTILNCLLAGPYSMALFGATNSRMFISWLVSAGVFGLVGVVKFLPYPWRSITDGGVVCGLSIGAFSIVYYYTRAVFGRYPGVNPCLPDNKIS
jgi:hypothetical protein